MEFVTMLEIMALILFGMGVIYILTAALISFCWDKKAKFTGALVESTVKLICDIYADYEKQQKSQQEKHTVE